MVENFYKTYRVTNWAAWAHTAATANKKGLFMSAQGAVYVELFADVSDADLKHTQSHLNYVCFSKDQ